MVSKPMVLTRSVVLLKLRPLQTTREKLTVKSEALFLTVAMAMAPFDVKEAEPREMLAERLVRCDDSRRYTTSRSATSCRWCSIPIAQHA